jgi:hypothetical protein
MDLSIPQRFNERLESGTAATRQESSLDASDGPAPVSLLSPRDQSAEE